MIRHQYFFDPKQLEIVNNLNSLIDENIINRSCNLCKCNKFEPISKIDRYDLKYYTGICLNCGLHNYDLHQKLPALLPQYLMNN